MHVRTTLVLDDALLERAAELTGIEEETAIVRVGFEAQIAREAAEGLAGLGRTRPNLLSLRRQ